MRERIAQRAAREAFAIERGPAVFRTRAGERVAGEAEVAITRSSIALRFAPDAPLVVAKAAYGEDNGSLGALDGRWNADGVTYARRLPSGEHLFTTMTLRDGAGSPQDAALTRLVIAGDAWRGTGSVAGRAVVVAPLSTADAPTHHERRLSVTVDGALDATEIEAMRAAASFVAGIDVELLRIERIDDRGVTLAVEHHRGYRRVGRGTHSPFTGVADDERMRAWSALVEAFPRLRAEGVPIEHLVDQIAAHNQVAQINVSAQLLLLSIVTAAHHRLHGTQIGAPSASRRAELERLDAALGLGLGDDDFERYERLRVELLDAGFFHAPGYETGRPQKDIKFLRDLAHVVVLRLCGYSGPFYGAERFAVRELAHAP